MNDPMLLDAALPAPKETFEDFIMNNPAVVVIAGIVLIAAIVLVIAIVKNNNKK